MSQGWIEVEVGWVGGWVELGLGLGRGGGKV